MKIELSFSRQYGTCINKLYNENKQGVFNSLQLALVPRVAALAFPILITLDTCIQGISAAKHCFRPSVHTNQDEPSFKKTAQCALLIFALPIWAIIAPKDAYAYLAAQDSKPTPPRSPTSAPGVGALSEPPRSPTPRTETPSELELPLREALPVVVSSPQRSLTPDDLHITFQSYLNPPNIPPETCLSLKCAFIAYAETQEGLIQKLLSRAADAQSFNVVIYQSGMNRNAPPKASCLLEFGPCHVKNVPRANRAVFDKMKKGQSGVTFDTQESRAASAEAFKRILECYLSPSPLSTVEVPRSTHGKVPHKHPARARVS